MIFIATPYFSYLWELSEKSMTLTTTNATQHYLVTSIVFLCIHFTIDFFLSFPLEICNVFIDNLYNNNHNNKLNNFKYILYNILLLPIKIMCGFFLCFVMVYNIYYL